MSSMYRWVLCFLFSLLTVGPVGLAATCDDLFLHSEFFDKSGSTVYLYRAHTAALDQLTHLDSLLDLDQRPGTISRDARLTQIREVMRAPDGLKMLAMAQHADQGFTASYTLDLKQALHGDFEGESGYGVTQLGRGVLVPSIRVLSVTEVDSKTTPLLQFKKVDPKLYRWREVGALNALSPSATRWYVVRGSSLYEVLPHKFGELQRYAKAWHKTLESYGQRISNLDDWESALAQAGAFEGPYFIDEFPFREILKRDELLEFISKYDHGASVSVRQYLEKYQNDPRVSQALDK